MGNDEALEALDAWDRIWEDANGQDGLSVDEWDDDMNTIRQALERQRVPVWPQPDERERALGWTYDYKWLTRVQDTAKDMIDPDLGGVSMEEVDVILQALEIVGAAPEANDG